jgi:hypothetical protein
MLANANLDARNVLPGPCGVFRQSSGTIYNYGLDAFPILKEDSPLRHQNQPPDGTRPLNADT